MTSQILLKRAQGPRETLLLDTGSGRCAPVTPPAGTPSHGTLATIAGQNFALYAQGDTLWFQWNERRWPLQAVSLTYGHDLAAESTTFTADGRSLTYPAWWAGDPTYEPLVPEQDEQEDWLAYVVAVQANPGLQASLVDAWG